MTRPRPHPGRPRRPAALAAAALAPLAGLTACTQPARPGAGCPVATVRTLAQGLPALENLLVEPDGSLLLSVPGTNALRRRFPDGRITTVASGLPGTGGLAQRDGTVYVTTGSTSQAMLAGSATGTIERIDLATGARQTWARRLVAPNGLALLPDGSAVTTVPLVLSGTRSDVTLVPAADPTRIDRHWSDLSGTNGVALDPTGQWLYLSRSLAPRAEVWRLSPADPRRREKVAEVGDAVTEFLDDLTVAPDGRVYVAANLSGKVHRVDPATGAHCELATGLPEVSAVEWAPSPGGTGPGVLYAVSRAGRIYEIALPA